MMNARLFCFVGGSTGDWAVTGMTTIVGAPLSAAARLAVVADAIDGTPADAAWCLRGIRSNERYVTAEEKAQLVAKQEGLGRAAASRAALIPVRKTAAWWSLAQDERRRIFEERSHHTAIGLKYLPAIARRLHHCRDLGVPEPFDFLTWFEFAPADEPAFDDLVAALRATEEWHHVDREIDIRLTRST